jgi:hypothetical protein
MKKPYLAKLGWTMETLRIAQSYGHVLFSERVEDELEEWEEYLKEKEIIFRCELCNAPATVLFHTNMPTKYRPVIKSFCNNCDPVSIDDDPEIMRSDYRYIRTVLPMPI